MKKCYRCKKFKEYSCFNKDNSRTDGCQRMCIVCYKEYNNECKAHNKQRDANYYKTHIEEIKVYRQSPEVKKKHNEQACEYAKKYPHKVNAIVAKRKAAKLQRTPKWLTSLHYQQIEMFYDAAAKLTKEFGIKMVVDHMTPLQGENVSGLHVPWNLQVISQVENAIKGNRFE